MIKDPLTEKAFENTTLVSNMSEEKSADFLIRKGKDPLQYRVINFSAFVRTDKSDYHAGQEALENIARQAIGKKCEYISNINKVVYSKARYGKQSEVEITGLGLIPISRN